MSSPDAFFDGFLDDYFAESDEHLAAAADALLRLDKSLGQPSAERAAVDDLFRYFHTLKAISAMVELRPAEELAHHLEHYLRAIREGENALTTGGTDALIEGTRRLEHIIRAHRDHQPSPAIDDVLARIEALIGVPGTRPVAETGTAEDALDSTRRWICTFSPTRELLESGIGVDLVRKRLSEIGTIVGAAPQVRPDATISFQFTLMTAGDVNVAERLAGIPLVVEADAPPVEPASLAPADSSSTAGAPHAAPSPVVRVDLARLDHLMQGVGDMVISKARLAESLNCAERYVPAAEWRAIQENSVALDRQLRMLREGIMRVRMVPVGEIFRRMPLVVRDLAREKSKRVRLELRGQSTEIDKYLIERMTDPVLHLVRNAVSHGIEPPDIRISRGKNPEGTITLSAAAVGDCVTVEVSDDGYGVDEEAVIEKARLAGMSVPAGPLDAAAILALLCAPGFSTNEETDRASGRGVGMAVVKRTVEELSGSIALDTQPGQGTRFIISLPVTLAITDALIGRVGDEAFAIPQGSVREVIEIAEADMRRLEENEIAPYREGALPIIRLSRLFGINSAAADRFHVFVLGHGSSAIGIAVDRIIGQREIVVRTMADPLVRVDGVSGATDLGDGRVVLILDPAMLARLTTLRARRVMPDAAAWGRLRA
jgi:two-component system, chemotaxis family, sensor kinase CheA